MKNISIVEATIEDTPTILEFIRIKPNAQIRANEDIIRRDIFGPNPKAKVLFAKTGAQPLGMAIFHDSHSGFLGKAGFHIEGIYILPEYNSEDISTKLMNYITQKALEDNYGKVSWNINQQNHEAEEFYHKIGSKPLSEWKNFAMHEQKLRNIILKQDDVKLDD
jgi:GNAT superfamily N-acetyltransferase